MHVGGRFGNCVTVHIIWITTKDNMGAKEYNKLIIIKSLYYLLKNIESYEHLFLLLPL